MDIDELYKLARENDIPAEKQLFLILNESFQLFIQKRVWNRQDSEEIVQEAMMTIAQKYKNVEIRESFAAWAYTVLKYKILDYIKLHGIRTSNTNQFFNQLPDDPVVQPDPIFKLRLLACLKKICKKNIRYARILNFHYQGYSTEKICDKMNLKPNGFYVLLYRARSLLKACINSKNDKDISNE